MSDSQDLQGVYINDRHQLAIVAGGHFVELPMTPVEMRKVAAAVLLAADALDREAFSLTTIALAKASGRPN